MFEIVRCASILHVYRGDRNIQTPAGRRRRCEREEEWMRCKIRFGEGIKVGPQRRCSQLDKMLRRKEAWSPSDDKAAFLAPPIPRERCVSPTIPFQIPLSLSINRYWELGLELGLVDSRHFTSFTFRAVSLFYGYSDSLSCFSTAAYSRFSARTLTRGSQWPQLTGICRPNNAVHSHAGASKLANWRSPQVTHWSSCMPRA